MKIKEVLEHRINELFDFLSLLKDESLKLISTTDKISTDGVYKIKGGSYLEKEEIRPIILNSEILKCYDWDSNLVVINILSYFNLAKELNIDMELSKEVLDFIDLASSNKAFKFLFAKGKVNTEEGEVVNAVLPKNNYFYDVLNRKVDGGIQNLDTKSYCDSLVHQFDLFIANKNEGN